MGLDISVMRPKMVESNHDDSMNDYTYLLSESPELEIFKDFAYDKVNTYYDLEGDLSKMGFSLDDLEWKGTEYGRTVRFCYYNKKHELYELHQVLNRIWSNCYFDTKKELFESEFFKEFSTYLPLLKKYGYRPLYKFFATGSKKTYYNVNSAVNFVKRKIDVVLKNPSTFDRTEKCITCVEVGYQRKGANSKFYEDGMWGKECVVDSKTLNDHWEKYFSAQTPDSPGGWGSGVEYDMEDDEMRSHFKENIIDNFVEGETFVIYQ
jgi:hypothetical protein